MKLLTTTEITDIQSEGSQIIITGLFKGYEMKELNNTWRPIKPFHATIHIHDEDKEKLFAAMKNEKSGL